MAVRENNNAKLRRAFAPAILIAIIGILGLSVRGLMLDRASAASGESKADLATPGVSITTTPAVPVAPASALVSLEGVQFPYDEGAGGYLVGEYEGEFNPATGKFSLREKTRTGVTPGRTSGIAGRFNPGAEVPLGAGFSFSIVNTAYVDASSSVGMASGEVQVTNNTTSTLYNARVIFTSFKVNTAAGPDASNLPGATGLTYYNDGLVPFNGKLNVSRLIGDIAAGSSVKSIWNFAVQRQPTNKFSFAYKVVADLGVAVESVQPAAVQVTSSTGTSVVIGGRGFSTPTVQILNAAGTVVASPAVSASTATSLTVDVPAGTAAGNYSVRVTNQGGTAGGAGSSTLVGRLSVTGAPDGAHTLTGAVTSLADTGPYLFSGPVTLGNATQIVAGTVIYLASGATVTVASGGTITANGGIIGVPTARGIANPNQIVLTAQRAAGAALPTSGAWGGLNATAAATSTLTMSNVVVEYGGTVSNPAINLSGSGRTLSLSDSIVRNSAGSAIGATGVNDAVKNFARNSIENNGTTATDPALLLSANASLGLFELPGSDVPKGTSAGDASYFYSSGNDFRANTLNAVQIGTAAAATSNDFTKTGVLVGQGSTPIVIQGSSSNPALINTELTVGPTSVLQLAPAMNLLVGDYATDKTGGLSVIGSAGFYQGTQTATSNQYVEVQNIPGSGNFGSIFFSRLSLPSSILSNVRIQSGGNGALGTAPLIIEGANLAVTGSRIDGGMLETLGAQVTKTGSTFTNTASSPIIETIAGGILGDRNLGTKAIVSNPTSLALDPLGRGLFIADTPGTSYIRFLNTTRQSVTLAGITVPAGVIKIIAGGGTDFSDNVPGMQSDIGVVTGIAVSPDGNTLYFIDSITPNIRAINLADTAKTIAGAAGISPGNIQNFAQVGLGSAASTLATHPTTGDLYVCDSTAGVNKVLRYSASPANTNTAPVTIAGNGVQTKDEDPFLNGQATMIPLLGPRALAFNGNNVIISDSGHGRVIQVNSAGEASLISQLPFKSTTANPPSQPYSNNPYTAGLAFLGGKVFMANGNAQDLIRIDTISQAGQPPNFTMIAGQVNITCDYTSGNCGDGGPSSAAQFTLTSRTATVPVVGLVSDGKGLYIADQGPLNRGRIRYINLSASTVEIAGVTITPDSIDTVAGAGLAPPYEGAIATSGALNQPVGVAMDPDGNLWITDTNINKLRFANLGATQKIIFPSLDSEKVVEPGTIVTVNSGGSLPDPTKAITAFYDNPHGVAATAQGIFIADAKKGPVTTSPNRKTGLIRFLNTTSQSVTLFPTGAGTSIVVPAGESATIAGGSVNGDAANVGDGAAPLAAKFIGPTDILIHPTNGNIYVADAGNRRVRMINRQTGAVSTLSLPTTSPNEYTGLGIDSTGRLLVANAGGRSILREKTPGSGNAANGFDTIVNTGLSRPRDLVEGRDGALYVINAGDSSGTVSPNNQIVKITINETTKVGTVTTFLGSAMNGYAGDGKPIGAGTLIDVMPEPINVATVGTAVTVRTTVNIILGLNGELIFSDSKNNAIRRVR